MHKGNGLFERQNDILDETVGWYPHQKVHSDTHPDMVPKLLQVYAGPHNHLETLKKVLKPLIQI